MLVTTSIFVLLTLLAGSVIGPQKSGYQPVAYKRFLFKRPSGESTLFYVITRTYPNGGKRFLVGDATSLRAAGFNPSHPTRILIHGWRSDRSSLLNSRVSASYLNRGNYNVIVVDWSQVADRINYLAAKEGIQRVAPKIVKLLEFLNLKGNTSPDKVHLIAHSLGAHLAGAVGRRLTSGKIGVIVALDPALPLYILDMHSRLSQWDATYVVGIHTNGGVLGIFEPIGHADFYPSWGKLQPGCGIDIHGMCSHKKSVDYFAESLEGSTSKFKSRRCNTIWNLIKHFCPEVNGKVLMGGDPIDRTARGIFFVPI